MRNRIIAHIFLTASLAVAAVAQAVPAPAHTPNPERQARVLGKRLGLSPDQVAQIEPFLADRDSRVQSLRADASLAPRDRAAQLRSLRQDFNSRMEAVMTPAQKQQFEALQQREKERRTRPASQ